MATEHYNVKFHTLLNTLRDRGTLYRYIIHIDLSASNYNHPPESFYYL